ncbi:hypothetical protein F4809DRAFT_336939 [Biscogniauxia mediterranea]|nr:hypothetical protein F4809DRAFT_336939 [Biscogniauxia mediterranea]
MKGSKPVCTLCRHRVAIGGQVRSPQRQPSRTSPFTTTAAAAANTSKGYDTTEAKTIPRNNDEHTADKPTDKQERPILRAFVTNTPDRRFLPSASRQTFRNKAGEPSSLTEKLFQQIVQEQQAPLNSLKGSMNRPSSGQGTSLQLLDAVRALQEMVDSGRPVAQAYAYLKTEIYPLVRQPGEYPPKDFRSVVLGLMEKIIAEKRADMFTDSLPSVVDIFRVYADIGDLKPLQWATLVGDLVRAILDPGVGNRKGQQTKREAMLMDLVESWKILSVPQVSVLHSHGNDIKDGWWIPNLEKASLQSFAQSGNFTAAFDSLFPRYSANQLGAPVAVLAIATYTILTDSQRTPADVRQSALRFLTSVADIITFVPIPDDTFRREIEGTFPDLEEYIMGQWPIVRSQLKTRLQAAHLSGTSTQAAKSLPRTYRAPGTADYADIWRGLSEAFKKRNSNQVNRLWEAFVGPGTTLTKEKATELCGHPNLFDSFVHARMALNQPDEAIKVLDLMNMIKLTPTIRTWSRMLDGCGMAGNAVGIKNVWTKLASSGMKLDTVLWTNRVEGLIESGDIRAGIQALEEMTRLWKTDPKTRSSAAIQPTIEPVNAALAGLIRRNHLDVAVKLLLWARKQNIEPDVITFNTMLRAFIRNGRDGDVRDLFNTMQELGVKADATTFTIVLDAAFSKYNPVDPKVQAKIVSEALSEMEAVGLPINMATYGKMVYLLFHSNSLQAAKALIEHIWATENKLSPHIYTMLVEHYFSRSPPDVNAVDRLLERLLERHESFVDEDLDRAFCDRLVQGYAAAGRPDVALKMYYRLTERGFPVILGSQEVLLGELLRHGRVEDARKMVNNTRRQSLQRFGEHDAKIWHHRFWHLAQRYNLIDPTITASSVDAASEEEGTSPAAP